MDKRNLEGYSPWGRKESDTTEMTEHACMTIFTYLHTLPVPCTPTRYPPALALA